MHFYQLPVESVAFGGMSPHDTKKAPAFLQVLDL